MKYRAEIDGLRALAVIPVIFFHAGFEAFAGGFVGVDVFFVISGYLITSLLIAEIEHGSLDLVQFYERRARRILPALFFVIACCLPVAWSWMLPHQLEEFAGSILAVSFFVSNVFFWLQSGYFAQAAEQMPLLHTWSLAVEEQFYILFPLYLIVAWRWGRTALISGLVLISLVSFGLSEWGWRNTPSANFFLTPSRVWELLVGAFAAFHIKKRGVSSNSFLSWFGLALIGVSVATIDKTSPFPSFLTLLPVLGTVFVILWAGPTTLPTRVLSWRPLVAVGLVSYSAYLWHQPLFAFARLRFKEEPQPVVMLVLCGLSLLLAAITWRWVEQPFRNRKKVGRRFVFLASGVGITVMASIGLLGTQFNGFPNRLTQVEQAIVRSLDNKPKESYHVARVRTEFQGPPGTRLLILGDSFGKDLLEGLEAYFGDRTKKIDIVLGGISRRCKNVLSTTQGIENYLAPQDRFCFGNYPRIGSERFETLINTADLILVRSMWDVFPTQEMPQTYAYLNARAPGRVVFIGSTVFGMGYNTAKSRSDLANLIAESDPSDELPYSILDTDLSVLDLIRTAKINMDGLNYISVHDFFCQPDTRCNLLSPEGLPYNVDAGHLGEIGERFMVEQMFALPWFLELWERNLSVAPN